MAGALQPYRVLDLTTSRGWLCGKMLADLGADVVKIEPPGGDPGRSLGPFAGGVPGPERSLRWWFLNRGKRSATLDLATADGAEIFRRLVGTAHVVLDSFDPGVMESLGLGHASLAASRTELVTTSITPFGSAGPHAFFEGPDLILGAAGGQVWLTGDPDRPPVRISVPQYEYHGAAEAAVHTIVALYHASAHGVGQHVDVAAQLAVIRTLMNAVNYPVLEGRDLSRVGGSRASSAIGIRMIYACRDGHVTSMLGGIAGTRALMQWMAEEGDVPEWLSSFDWENTDFAAFVRTPEAADFFRKVGEELDAFFARHTKRELYDGALKRRLLLAPVNTVADIRSDEQLRFRDYFVPVDHGEHGQVSYAGPWARMTATPLADTPRAPHVGEHTAEVFAEAGLGPEQLRSLSAAGVV